MKMRLLAKKLHFLRLGDSQNIEKIFENNGGGFYQDISGGGDIFRLSIILSFS